MRTGIFTLAALAFGGLAAAQPHRRNPRHADLHEKREYVTEYDVVTVTAPAVLVYVDGTTTWTETQYPSATSAPSSELSSVAAPSSADEEPASSTEAQAPSTPAPVVSEKVAAVSIATSSSTTEQSSSTKQAASSTKQAASSTKQAASSTKQAASSTKQAASSTKQAASSTKQAASSTQQAASSAKQAASSTEATAAASSSASSGNGYGMSYNPYTSSGDCKTQDEVNSDIDVLSEYSLVRIYGTDCNQTYTVPHAVAQHPGMKLMLGISNSDLASPDSAVDLIISGVNAELASSWDRIDSISVGNEAVSDGAGSVSTVVSALNSVRSQLRAAQPNAYTGPVVTVEQVGAIIDTADGSGLQLCQNSDYTAANCHAFFDTSGDYTTGSRAGDFVGMQYERLVKGCGNARTVITESGWPWSTVLPLTDFADTEAKPSIENQEAAIASLKKQFESNPGDVVLFSAFDDAWKQNSDGTKGAEGFWGVNHN